MGFYADHEGTVMILTERKSKYKYKVTVPRNWVYKTHEIQEWCADNFGPGGRSRRLRWRYGWLDDSDTFYFRDGSDATLFTLRWT